MIKIHLNTVLNQEIKRAKFEYNPCSKNFSTTEVSIRSAVIGERNFFLRISRQRTTKSVKQTVIAHKPRHSPQ